MLSNPAQERTRNRILTEAAWRKRAAPIAELIVRFKRNIAREQQQDSELGASLIRILSDPHGQRPVVEQLRKLIHEEIKNHGIKGRRQ